MQFETRSFRVESETPDFIRCQRENPRLSRIPQQRLILQLPFDQFRRLVDKALESLVAFALSPLLGAD